MSGSSWCFLLFEWNSPRFWFLFYSPYLLLCMTENHEMQLASAGQEIGTGRTVLKIMNANMRTHFGEHKLPQYAS